MGRRRGGVFVIVLILGKMVVHVGRVIKYFLNKRVTILFTLNSLQTLLQASRFFRGVALLQEWETVEANILLNSFLVD